MNANCIPYRLYKFQFLSVVMQFNKQQIRKDLEVDTTVVLYSWVAV